MVGVEALSVLTVVISGKKRARKRRRERHYYWLVVVVGLSMRCFRRGRTLNKRKNNTESRNVF